jgi:hypothetical protein
MSTVVVSIGDRNLDHFLMCNVYRDLKEAKQQMDNLSIKQYTPPSHIAQQ